MIKVYHQTQHGKRFFENKYTSMIQDLELVAIGENVDSDLDLNTIYELCNSTNKLWWTEAHHPLIPKRGQVRSLSVGDIVNKDGQYWQVARFGWFQMERVGNALIKID